MKKFSILFMAIVMTFYIEQANASELVVMKTSGTSNYNVGDVIQSNDTIEVLEQSSLMLISSLGKKIQIKGPFIGTLSSSASSTDEKSQEKVPGIGLNVDLVQSLTRLFKKQIIDTSSLGAFRSIGSNVLSDPWSYDIYSEKAYCFQIPSELKLWRSKNGISEKLILKTKNDMVEVNWEAGDNFLNWPADLPIQSAKSYSAVLENGEKVKFEIHQAPGDFPTRIHTAAWMADKKCDKQAMLLVVNSDVDKMLEGLAQDGKF